MNPKNAFYVLELTPDATSGEIEREGRKLLGLFGVGAAKAKTYVCPIGSYPRDETMVREALALLRDLKRREREALLARLVPSASSKIDKPSRVLGNAPFPDAFLVGRYRGL